MFATLAALSCYDLPFKECNSSTFLLQTLFDLPYELSNNQLRIRSQAKLSLRLFSRISPLMVSLQKMLSFLKGPITLSPFLGSLLVRQVGVGRR